ncbi:hypothetical protein HMPREF3038_00539 [Akkermansia sp. KLE1797]|nr:hypothetical protein HMPREF3038_00539 [Akkermansia sp. KLE1797]KXU55375.1 hypothetical protein HMPREF3039_00482 [Akkermansia sp. KLE1798]KZA05846.1 hypothetical protein HMPREF1326_00425 [Akkermansia sp. KLE1605]
MSSCIHLFPAFLTVVNAGQGNDLFSQQVTQLFYMLFTLYHQNNIILFTFNILYKSYHQKAYYPQM